MRTQFSGRGLTATRTQQDHTEERRRASDVSVAGSSEKESELEIALEEVPVNDHQATGLAGNAAKNAQGQFTVLKDALESRIWKRIDGDHPVVS